MLLKTQAIIPMSKTSHIVLTTIRNPVVLQDLLQNIRQHGHLDHTVCWVVGDRKTPASAESLCRQITTSGLETHYLGIEQQDAWGKKFPELYASIPYDNETRRNIGYLKAMEHGCERLISIDDDNFPTEDDFIGFHQATGSVWERDLAADPSGYINICEYLELEPERLIFPRGFPFQLRGMTNDLVSIPSNHRTRIGVTAGLWLKEPDIDATTWLNGTVQSLKFTGPARTVLDQGTWTPINTQNTSVASELIPAFLCVPMGYEVPGGKIERYGDIWGGYFLQAVLQGTDYHVSFGRPIVEHRRNPHDYLADLRHEYWGMMLTDWLLGHLHDQFVPSESSIPDRMIELSCFIKEIAVSQPPDWIPPAVSEYLVSITETMNTWGKTCKEIKGA